MRITFLISCLLLFCSSLRAQVSIVPLWHKQVIQLNQKLPMNHSDDSLTITKFACYFSKLTLLNQGQVVYTDSNTYLWNLERTSTLFNTIPKQLVYNELRISIGTDSLSNVIGAMSGDLDPMHGMYWSWQSGYINLKLEGTYPKLTTRNHAFQFHLGGYLAPFATYQTISFPIQPNTPLTLFVQVDKLLDSESDYLNKPEVMSPGVLAVQLSKVFANSFTTNKP